MYQLYVRGDDAFVEDCVSRAVKQRLYRVLPDRRHRALQPARTRHRQALRPRKPAARYRRRFPEGAGVAHRETDQGQVQDSPGHQGNRHRGRRGAGGRSRRRLDLCVEPWRTPARSRPRLDARAAGDRHAVAGRAKIMVDGSFCRGTDIVKAIAMGADLVGIGRLQCWALAANGEAGISACWSCSRTR